MFAGGDLNVHSAPPLNLLYMNLLYSLTCLLFYPAAFMEMHNRRQIDEDSLSGNSYGSADVSDAAWVRTQKGIFRMLWY